MKFSPMKIIKSFGRFVVRMYNREATRLSDEARKEAIESRELALRSRELADSADTKIEEAAHVAAQAQQLSKFFA